MAKIPEQAKKVFSGVIFDVYQWDQEMYDGTTEVFEMLKRQDTTEVLATVGDKIMIQDQEQPNKSRFWSLPGGRIELGEDPLLGAKRELIEESGYVSDHWELVSAKMPTSKMDWTIYVYVARHCRKVQQMQLDVGEKIELRWVTLDELIEMVDSGTLAQIEQDLRVRFVRAKYNAEAKNELKKLIFG
jgi:ADP-ribose pyrophosphatase